MSHGVLRFDWSGAFVPEKLLEVFIRGSIVYLSVFLLLRFFLKRESGTIGIPDLLMTVLISDAAQNAMTADYHSVTDGLFLVTTIVFWNYALDWLGYHIPWLERFVHPPPLPLILNGRLMRKHMKEELVTEEELRGHLREQGVLDVSDVKCAFMESNGHISVVKKGGKK